MGAPAATRGPATRVSGASVSAPANGPGRSTPAASGRRCTSTRSATARTGTRPAPRCSPPRRSGPRPGRPSHAGRPRTGPWPTTSVRRPGAQRRIEWLDGPDGDDAPAPLESSWTGLADLSHPEPAPEPAANLEAWKDEAWKEEGHDGWTDEEWFRLGEAPTEELFTRRTMPRSHRRPEPLRKATLRVLAAVLVAGGGVGLTMNLTSGDGGNAGAPARVEDRALQRVDGPVMPVPSASATPTDAQTTDGQANSAAIAPLAPATTRKATAVTPTTPQPTTAPPAVAPAPAPTTPVPTTPVPTTPVPTTPPPTTDPTRRPRRPSRPPRRRRPRAASRCRASPPPDRLTSWPDRGRAHRRR